MWSTLLEPLYPKWRQAASTAAGDWVALDWLGVLSFTGTKRNDFLQGYYTRNLDHLRPDHALYGATCDLHGRIVCNGWLFADAESTRYRVSADLLATAQQTLARYAPFTRTAIEPSDWLGVGLLGARAEALGDAPLGHTRAYAGGVLLRVHGAAPRYELWMPAAAAGSWINAIDTPPAAADIWLAAEIEAGVATVDAGTSGRYLPQQLGMNELQAIDFNKGCYLGQEIVARLQYRGTTKRTLQRLHTRQASDGVTLFAADKKVGEIVARARVEDGQVALAVLVDQAGGDLTDECGALWIRAEAPRG